MVGIFNSFAFVLLNYLVGASAPFVLHSCRKPRTGFKHATIKVVPDRLYRDGEVNPHSVKNPVPFVFTTNSLKMDVRCIFLRIKSAVARFEGLSDVLGVEEPLALEIIVRQV